MPRGKMSHSISCKHTLSLPARKDGERAERRAHASGALGHGTPATLAAQRGSDLVTPSVPPLPLPPGPPPAGDCPSPLAGGGSQPNRCLPESLAAPDAPPGGRGAGSRWLQRENSENEGLPGLAGESEARFLAPTLAVCVDVPVPVPNSAPLLKGRTSSRRIRAHTDGLTVP